MLTYIYKMSKIEENVNKYRPEMSLRTGPKVKIKLLLLTKRGFYVVPIISVTDFGINWMV